MKGLRRTAVVLVALLGLLVVLAPSASAAPSVPSRSSEATSSGATCVAHNVTLHGTQPASVSCAKWSAKGVSPNTEEYYCEFGNSHLTLEIFSAVTGD